MYRTLADNNRFMSESQPALNVSGKNILGFIFDLDGTLLNTLRTLAQTYNSALASLGYSAHPEDAYRMFVGDGARKCVERCLGIDNPVNDNNSSQDARLLEQINHVLEMQRSLYEQSWQAGTHPYPGISETLDILSARGFKLGVLSNKDNSFTQKLVRHYFGEDLFDVIQGHEKDIPLKPHPEGAIKVASDLGLNTSEIAFIGDSKMDIQTALACNMVAIGVSWGFRNTDELSEAGSHIIIDSPLELLNETLK